MNEQIDQLNQWLADLDSKHPVDWGMLPDIGLYMDQVQTYIDRQLGLYRRDEADRLLTPAMINNYIKDNLIPRAETKKYTSVHLALLIMIGTLKQVLSITNLNQLLSSYRDSSDVSALYRRYLEIQHDALKENAAQVMEETNRLAREAEMLLAAEANRPAAADETGETAPAGETGGLETATVAALRNLALELSIEARTRILIAEKILALLEGSKLEEPDKKKESDSKKRSNNK